MNNSKEKIITSALSGFMELLPAQQILFNKIFDEIKKIYEVFGFIPLDSPVLERSEVLLAKAGGETEKQIYQFTKGDTNLAMRFDLTVPLARYVAEHYGQLVFPFRRYAMSKVYRGERPQAGRFREFYQCDIDVIGNETLDIRYDAEIPSIIYMIFKNLGFEKFTIRINNRKILNGLFADLGASDISSQIMQTIDKLEKAGLDQVNRVLLDLGLSQDKVNKLFDFINLKNKSQNIISELNNLKIQDTQFITGVNELEQVVNIIKEFGVPEANFAVDLTIARGLDYYTGTVYETRLDDYPEIGSVCSGGRYDDLASHYTKQKLPGVGISIGLTRLFDQLIKREVWQAESSTLTRVLILPMTTDLAPSISLANKLRTNNIPTEISFSTDKIKKALGYADKLGIPYAIFIGEDEIAKNLYTLKDLKTGKQELLDLVQVIEILKKQSA
ncbi:histidine--tRNA ligase [Candidatus Babeliales bacterium]|nr:histidine--tRNA ligase [Candidatus Babeliales bacterium]